MTKETLVNTVSFQIHSFFSQLQIYTTCYKSLVKLLLAELTKLENVTYSTIITVFCINKMAACTLGVQSGGKVEVEDTQSSGIITS